MNKLNPELISRAVELRESGLSYQEVAEKLGVSKNQAEHAIRLGGSVKPRLSLEQKEQIRTRRLQGETVDSIAKDFGVAATTIHRITKDLDLKHLKTDTKSLLEDYGKGLSYKDLGNKYGLTPRSVNSVITRSGVANRIKYISEENRAQLLEDRNNGVARLELSQRYNIGLAGVKHIIRKAHSSPTNHENQVEENQGQLMTSKQEISLNKNQVIKSAEGAFVINGHLTQKTLQSALIHFLGEKSFLGSEMRLGDTRKRLDMVFEINGEKLVVEFDGDLHYKESLVLKRDMEKDSVAKELGYKLVRFPYWIQLTTQTLETFFGIRGEVCQDFPHGFISTKSFPASFCNLGLERFFKELESLPENVREDVLFSLRERSAEHGERFVLPGTEELTLNAQKLRQVFGPRL